MLRASHNSAHLTVLSQKERYVGDRKLPTQTGSPLCTFRYSSFSAAIGNCGALIVRRLFSSLYYEDFDRTSLSLEIQAEVLVKNGEDGGADVINRPPICGLHS
jgi:hypothetical protein